MREYNLIGSLYSLENLESKLSPTSLFVGAVAAAAVSPLNPHDQAGDDLVAVSDPLPKPEHPPVLAADNPPVVYPILPPSGPSGPGS